MSIPAIADDDLVIDFEAVEYASGAWSELDEEVTVHVFITIVDAGES